VELGARRIEQHHGEPPCGADPGAGQAEKAFPALRAFRARPAHPIGAVEREPHQARHDQPDQPGREERVADVAPQSEAGDGGHDENGGHVAPGQAVEQRHPLRQEFGRGEGGDRGARLGHVFYFIEGERRADNSGTVWRTVPLALAQSRPAREV
jgi:hypothetical protein